MVSLGAAAQVNGLFLGFYVFMCVEGHGDTIKQPKGRKPI